MIFGDFGFFSPDRIILLKKKIFSIVKVIISMLSVLAVIMVTYEVGVSRDFLKGWKHDLFGLTLVMLSLAYILKIAVEWERNSWRMYGMERFMCLFLLFCTSLYVDLHGFLGVLKVFGELQVNLTIVLLGFLLFVVELSKLSLSVNQLKIHPALVFVLSFMVVILLGTVLLLLPNSTTEGISVVDALFTSTSAVCVTGLIVLDTATDFTFLGQFFILILFQVGGLGMMTFTSFFGFFFKGSYSLKNQLFLKDYINEENIGAINSTLVKIILFTIVTVAFAAMLIFFFVDKGLFYHVGDQLFFSVFHSVSGFCNAGFSILSDGLYELGFREQYTVHLIIAFAIILGGIGFPVVLGYYNYLKHVMVGTKKLITGEEEYRHASRVVNVNIRLIVYTTGILLLIGFITFWIFEKEHTLEGLSGYGKFVTIFFGAVTPRTAGFNTVDMSALAMPTILIYLILMWIGASPGSTGGGLKTSTIAVAVLNAVSIARGKDRVEIFRRRIGNETLRKAFAVILLSFLVIGLGVFTVLRFDPQLALIHVAFEIFSAFSTVGLSLGITGDLSTGSKVVVTIIMFLGRVGTLTMLVAFVRKARTLRYKYPEEGVFIT